MDFKYIEELLRKYQDCTTSVEEEEILRSFFTVGEVPDKWLPYKYLFCYQETQQSIGLGDEFDRKVLAGIEKPVVKARRITLRTRMAPLLRSAAIVALVLGVTTIIHHSFVPQEVDYNYDTYTDTYDDPQVAYQEVSSALEMLSEKMNRTRQLTDTVVGGQMVSETILE